MNEAALQTLFTKWVTHNFHETFAYELKFVNTDKKTRINLRSDIRPQQIPWLIRAMESCVHKKLSDLDPSQKPFDAMQICNAPAYLIVLFYSPRQPKQLLWIDPSLIQSAMDLNIKSLTETQCRQLSSKITML